MARAKQRKRNSLIKREPSGRPSRSDPNAPKACAPAEVRRLRDAALAQMQDHKWGTELGRLFLNGKISAPCFAAGTRWAELVASYRNALSAPQPSPKAASIERQGHTQPIDPDSESGAKRVEIDRQTVLDFTDAHRVLTSLGMLAEQAVRSACERGEPVLGHYALEALNRGLVGLSGHWGLTVTTKSGR